MSVESFLESGLKTRKDGFHVRLKHLTHTWKHDGTRVTGHFHYISFRDGQPTLHELVDYLFDQIVHFCIPRKAIEEAIQETTRTGHVRHVQALVEQARHLFQRAQASSTKKSSQGEPAELILFLLLECVLNAPQVACKMYLKTSENMVVHGSDGIHIGGSRDALTLYWGESKLYQQASAACDKVMESVATFTTKKAGRSPRDRDLAILRDHLDISDTDLKQALLAYFDPYIEASNSVTEAFACFIGFDSPIYKDLSTLEKEAAATKFESSCTARLVDVANLFVRKLRTAGLEKLSFELFLIPFTDVEEFRKQFFAKIGVPS